jgi:hypothetical protein
MKQVHRNTKGRNRHPDVPLFIWADRRCRIYRLPLAARHARYELRSRIRIAGGYDSEVAG